MPPGHFSMFLSTSSFVFCNKRGEKNLNPSLPTALCWRQAWKDVKVQYSARVGESSTLSSLQGSGTLVEGGVRGEACEGCPLRQATALPELSVLYLLLPGLVDHFLSEGWGRWSFSHLCPSSQIMTQDYYF